MNRIAKMLKTQMKMGYWTGFTMAMYPGQFAYEKIDVDFEKVWSDRKEVNLYYHIPFCKSLCPYCGFFTIANDDTSYINKYVEQLNNQMREYASFLNNGNGGVIKSICFGGGTPNYIPLEAYEKIFDTLHKSYLFFDDAIEPSMEISPEIINEEYIKGLSQIGIRRLSLGVQSLNVSLRKKINRENNYDLLQLADIMRKYNMNINIDVMSGLVGQTPKMFMDTLEKLMEFKPETISIYPLAGRGSSMIKKSEQIMSNKEKYELFREFYDFLLNQDYYCESGIKFVKKNQSSTHQQKIYEYQGIDTMGVGCAARSYNYHTHYTVESGFNHKKRHQVLDEFLQDGYRNMNYYGIHIDEQERKCRFAIYGLFIGRVELDKYKELFNTVFEDDFKEQVEAILELELVKREGNCLISTKEGITYTDIMCYQFWSKSVNEKYKNIERVK